ncbi:MAG: phosphoadenosine phosphosulfate reductase family protein [Candidatus Nanohaloarchaea archaeon]
MVRNRVQAPKLNAGQHPDWFWSVSGGVDSVAAYLLTRDALHDNYGKRPVMVHLDTGIGLPANRLYLEELADRMHEQLWTLRTEENFREWVERDGAPGGGAHGEVKNELKDRQPSKLNTLADVPVYVLGLRAGESTHRAGLPKVVEKRRHVEVYPVHRLSREQCARIILEHEDVPINPCWLWNHATDCFCLAKGDPSEVDRVEERFPWFAQRLREIEEAASHDGLKGILGWDGLTAVEQDALEDGQEQLTLCGPACSRRGSPGPVEEAFRMVLDGASRDAAIAHLEA